MIKDYSLTRDTFSISRGFLINFLKCWYWRWSLPPVPPPPQRFPELSQLAMLLLMNLENIRSRGWGSKGARPHDPFKSFVQKGGTQKIQERWWGGACMACIQSTPQAPPSSSGRLFHRTQHQMWNSRASSQESRSSQKRTHRKTRSISMTCCPQRWHTILGKMLESRLVGYNVQCTLAEYKNNSEFVLVVHGDLGFIY
jgi:hypothetical protein